MRVVVVARGVGRWSLPHGGNPSDLLAEHGWVGEPLRAVLGSAGEIEVHYDVVELEHSLVPALASKDGPIVAQVDQLQRVAAYALIVDEERLLMSQLSDLVDGAAGLWTLPGGGVDPGEEPLAAVVREVHEETGQRVLVDGLVQVQSAHWAEGRGGGSRQHEDFHALRLIHRARCLRPRPVQVMELDGSTGAAAWVPFEELPDLPLAAMVREALPELAPELVPAGVDPNDLMQ